MAHTSATSQGTLYVVATPIGNLEDISQRAIAVLTGVDTILAEDTRHSQALLTALGIKSPLISFHAHNESNKCELVVQALLKGQTFALISDAGTPLISDPGFPLVRLAQEKGVPVVPIPGASALTAALSAAGVPCDVFTFVGFLPAKNTARQQKLATLKQEIAHTLVCYESTHRIVDSCQDIAQVFGSDCPMVLAKELTKTFERFIHGTVSDILTWLTEDSTHTKGEFVLIIPAREVDKASDEKKRVLSLLLKELSLKQAVTLGTELLGGNKNELYQLALSLSKEA